MSRGVDGYGVCEYCKLYISTKWSSTYSYVCSKCYVGTVEKIPELIPVVQESGLTGELVLNASQLEVMNKIKSRNGG